MLDDFMAASPVSTPVIPEPTLVQVGGDAPRPASPVVLVCIGTHLLVTGLLPAQGQYAAFECEGGMVTLPACNEEEAALVAWCMRRFGHASAECFLSWRGIRLLHEALADVRGLLAKPMLSEEVVRRARDGSDGLCGDAVDVFCALLGTVASNLAVTFGAFGGVYLRGEVMTQLGPFFAASSFRERFESKGRFSAYVSKMPVFVIGAS